VAAAGDRNGAHLVSAEYPLGVLETAVDTLTTAVEQLEDVADLGVTLVAVAEALNLLATDPDAGTIELDVISDGLTHIAAQLAHESIAEQSWAQPLVDARHAVSHLAALPRPVAGATHGVGAGGREGVDERGQHVPAAPAG